MPRGPALTAEALAKLGAERLAALVLDEAGRNAPFRKLASAALAGAKGPDAVAALIDRRLAALEKARGTIDWQKRRAFAADLAATLSTIEGELGALDPYAAARRLLRFVRGGGAVLDRVDDSNGAVLAVYDRAVEALPRIAAALPEGERADLAGALAGALGEDWCGFAGRSLDVMIALLPPERLRALDAALAAAETGLPRAEAKRAGEWRASAHRDRILKARQTIADRAGDVDAFLALETSLRGGAPDTLAVAERLLKAGRLAEALDWARRPRPGAGYMTHEDVADGAPPGDLADRERVALEVRVLDALGDRDAAQALRWAAFEERLEPEVLRDIVAHSPDFGEFEALDRAFALAETHPRRYAALSFLVAWPRLDRAARLVLAHRDMWDGGRWGVLAPAAEALEAEHPVAATVLHRALIDDVLVRGRSSAYGHAARGPAGSRRSGPWRRGPTARPVCPTTGPIGPGSGARMAASTASGRSSTRRELPKSRRLEYFDFVDADLKVSNRTMLC